MKYKVGDKVRCIESRYHSLTSGKIYEITEGIGKGGLICDNGIGCFERIFDKGDFELVMSSQDTEDRQSTDSPSTFRSIGSLDSKSCIHCTTKEQAEYICKLFDKAGLHRNGKTSPGTHYDFYGDRTVYLNLDGIRHRCETSDPLINTREIIPATEFGAPEDKNEEWHLSSYGADPDEGFYYAEYHSNKGGVRRKLTDVPCMKESDRSCDGNDVCPVVSGESTAVSLDPGSREPKPFNILDHI